MPYCGDGDVDAVLVGDAHDEIDSRRVAWWLEVFTAVFDTWPFATMIWALSSVPCRARPTARPAAPRTRLAVWTPNWLSTVSTVNMMTGHLARLANKPRSVRIELLDLAQSHVDRASGPADEHPADDQDDDRADHVQALGGE
jgi:hypothetical protein